MDNSLEAIVQQLVKTGQHSRRSAVRQEDARLLQDRETRLAALDASITRSIADIEAGRTTPAEDVFTWLESKYRSATERSG